MFRKKNAPAILVFLTALQVLSATYLLDLPNFYAIASFIFLLTGLGIAICLLALPPIVARKNEIEKKQLFLKFAIIILLLPLSYWLATNIMKGTILDYHDADMLPVIKTMGERFWSGHPEQVYQPIPDIWHGMKPIYLPAMWLPFSLSVVFKIDIRWVTTAGIWLTTILCVLPRWKMNYKTVVLVASMVCLLVWLHLDEDNSVIELTEEGVVFFYYALLVTALVFRNPWLLGLSIACCLLSRYSFIGWIPFAVVYLLIKKENKFLVKSTISCVIAILIFMLPFGLAPLLDHLHLHSQYQQHAARVWQDEPDFYYEDLGMAKFFGPSHIRLQHLLLEIGTFTLPLLFLFFVRKKIRTQPNILLAGLQLSLTFFYNFLDVTYLYLYYTPVFVSLLITAWSLHRKDSVPSV